MSGPVGVTDKRCRNVAPGLALRCEKMAGHRGLCRVSPYGVRSFSWNPKVVK